MTALAPMIKSEDTGCLAAVPQDVALWTPWGDLTGIPANDNRVPPCSGHADDNLPPVLAFTGLAGAGKSTASRYLVERYGYKLVKFAGPLKDMCRAIGLTEEQIEGHLKEAPSPMLQGKTPRYAMQTLGTQWGRDCIGKSFWVSLWGQRVLELTGQGHRVVVDDCRFPNEAAAIRTLGGDIIAIAARGGIESTHESESGIGTDPDAVLANSGSIEELHQKIEEVIRRWG